MTESTVTDSVRETAPDNVSREQQFLDVIEEIKRFGSLPVDWDTYGGNPAPDRVVRRARGLLERLQVIPDVPAPLARPITDGVFLEWRVGGRYLYFEFDRDSVLTCTREDLAGNEHFEETDSFAIDDAVRTVTGFIEAVGRYA